MVYKSEPYKEPTKPVGTVAELFAGVGGFRIGLSRAGWKTVFSNQWEPSTKTQHASDVYVARFGADGHSNEDIAKVDDIPEVDLLVGGFPCQDYSVAKSLNSSKGLEGKKGVLWWEILRLVGKRKPKYIFLENVDRLLKSPSAQRGRDFAIMLKTLGDAGYLVEWRIVNAAEYGFPQRRIRVFIVATRFDQVDIQSLDRRGYVLTSGILARALPVVHSVSSDSTDINLQEPADQISESFNVGGKKSPFLNAGIYLNEIATTYKVTAKPLSGGLTLGDVLVTDDALIPAEYWISEDRLPEWEFLKGAKTLERTHKSGAKYNYAEGKMAFPDLLTNPSRTILTGEGGTSPSRFKHIIKVGERYRRLLPIELERLNGFPDDWTATTAAGEKMPDVRRAFFMGNALVIGLIVRVGDTLARDIRSK